MTLVHYSKFVLQKSDIRSISQKSEPDHKPYGFWISVDGNNDGWREWCESENFRTNQLSVANIIELTDNANVLWLKTPVEVLLFSDKYKINLLGDRYRIIKWNEVAEQYQGVIIAPYQWSLRLSEEVNWYYTWDCASGCIWDATAIKKIYQRKEATHDQGHDGVEVRL